MSTEAASTERSPPALPADERLLELVGAALKRFGRGIRIRQFVSLAAPRYCCDIHFPLPEEANKQPSDIPLSNSTKPAACRLNQLPEPQT